ncbi:hypothetical protein EVAR_66643_1 [Eumeta japonica]|uniref:Uncharacterized protein n=1 Tax=Eumeta variegata TaxID=151549 RepID=A0A4C2A4X9_EUMVA|nr:hypothetical protein EVAR_66643_1 [Eumeta japonica]
MYLTNKAKLISAATFVRACIPEAAQTPAVSIFSGRKWGRRRPFDSASSCDKLSPGVVVFRSPSGALSVVIKTSFCESIAATPADRVLSELNQSHTCRHATRDVRADQ